MTEAQERLADQRLTDAIRELGAVVVTEHTLEELLGQVVMLARSTVTAADGASITLTRGRKFFTSHSTDEVMTELDNVQYAHGSGPCVQAIEDGRPVEVALASERDRYPAFADAAAARFVTAVCSYPFIAGDKTIGALNLYSATVEQFDDSDREVASMFAGQASALFANASAYVMSVEENENLQKALQSRDLIGQAKGIVMAREGCTADDAFDRLRRISQDANRKLTAIAQELVSEVEQA